MIKIQAFCHFLLFVNLGFGQMAEPVTSYLFPINPGQQNYLAGTMGELRSSHFHAGLDIKTGGREGLPVYATADGYISRIKVEGGGYGYALYMSHPDGNTSVYAHLSEFQEDIEKYVLESQYEEESFEVQLFPEEDQFVFKQGEVIAYSGNTGSSSGPHLHFEIRDKYQRILDPLNFNFKEIRDHLSPQLKEVAFVTLNGEARVNQTFGRFEFDVLKTSGKYHTRVPIELSGLVGVEVYAYDLMDGVYSRNGISRTTLVVDEDTVFSELKENLSFSKQRNILVHMDYEAYKSTGTKFNKLFVDDGNENDFYTTYSKGFQFSDSIHHIKIYLEDSYGNISTFETTVNNKKVINLPEPRINDFEVYRNYAHFKVLKDFNKEAEPVKLYFQGLQIDVLPYRVDHRQAFYLYDLRDGIPDSVLTSKGKIDFNIYAQIPSGVEMSFHNHDFDLFLKRNSLFDTLYLQFEYSYDSSRSLELFEFPHHKVPFFSYVRVALKPQHAYVDSLTAVYSSYGNHLNYMGGKWVDDKITFDTRELVTFTLAKDSLPPVINPRIVSSSQLYFKISDDLSGIESFRATLNGNFLLMKYEPKKNLIWAVPKEPNNPMKGEFILEVIDNIGNKSVYQRNL